LRGAEETHQPAYKPIDTISDRTVPSPESFFRPDRYSDGVHDAVKERQPPHLEPEPDVPASKRVRFEFAPDTSLEEAGFEMLVPRDTTKVSRTADVGLCLDSQPTEESA
jgi:hypothetical protein